MTEAALKARAGWKIVAGVALFVVAGGIACAILATLAAMPAIIGAGWFITFLGAAVVAATAAYVSARTRWSITTAVGAAIIAVAFVLMVIGGDASVYSAAMLAAGSAVAAVGIGLRLIRQ